MAIQRLAILAISCCVSSEGFAHGGDGAERVRFASSWSVELEPGISGSEVALLASKIGLNSSGEVVVPGTGVFEFVVQGTNGLVEIEEDIALLQKLHALPGVIAAEQQVLEEVQNR